MTEPTTTTVGAFVALISTTSTALLGVDYYSLVGSIGGALAALGRSDSMGDGAIAKIKAALWVAGMSILGAILGAGLVSSMNSTNRNLLMLTCAVCGFAAPKILAKLSDKLGS